MMTAPHDDQIVRLLSEPSHAFDDRGFHYHPSHGGSYAREILVDAAPAYPHDQTLVLDEFERLRRICPLPFPLAVFLLSHEERSRSNGTYYDEHNYQTDERIQVGEERHYPPAGFIVLSAKRIPPHPAMTRYLVSHEYGHGVMYHLGRLRGVDGEKLRVQYRERCRPTSSAAYGCGRWHAETGEMFANDFRILVSRREPEFWPHPGHPRPEDLGPVREFWAQAVLELGWTEVAAASEEQVA